MICFLLPLEKNRKALNDVFPYLNTPHITKLPEPLKKTKTYITQYPMHNPTKKHPYVTYQTFYMHHDVYM